MQMRQHAVSIQPAHAVGSNVASLKIVELYGAWHRYGAAVPRNDQRPAAIAPSCAQLIILPVASCLENQT